MARFANFVTKSGRICEGCGWQNIKIWSLWLGKAHTGTFVITSKKNISLFQVLQFLKKKDLVSDLVRHIGTSAISDFIIGLITGVDGDEIKQGNLTVSIETTV